MRPGVCSRSQTLRLHCLPTSRAAQRPCSQSRAGEAACQTASWRMHDVHSTPFTLRLHHNMCNCRHLRCIRAAALPARSGSAYCASIRQRGTCRNPGIRRSSVPIDAITYHGTRCLAVGLIAWKSAGTAEGTRKHGCARRKGWRAPSVPPAGDAGVGAGNAAAQGSAEGLAAHYCHRR